MVYTTRHWNILFAEPPEIVPFTFGADTIDQGKFAQLTCSIRSGDKPLTITWSLKGDIISSDPVITTTMIGQQTSMLIISSVDYQHSGVYTCRAENPAGVATYSAQLKVNGTHNSRHGTGNSSLQILKYFYPIICDSSGSDNAVLWRVTWYVITSILKHVPHHTYSKDFTTIAATDSYFTTLWPWKLVHEILFWTQVIGPS